MLRQGYYGDTLTTARLSRLTLSAICGSKIDPLFQITTNTIAGSDGWASSGPSHCMFGISVVLAVKQLLEMLRFVLSINSLLPHVIVDH
jgi:hypothetical protein